MSKKPLALMVGALSTPVTMGCPLLLEEVLVSGPRVLSVRMRSAKAWQ